MRAFLPRSWLSLGLLLVAGCNDVEGGWKPPAPAGVTYVYEYQGFKQQTRGGYGGVATLAPGVGLATGGGFNFREGSELRGEAMHDPFTESTPIDGVRFNEHLGQRGIPLQVRVATPAAPPTTAPPEPAQP